MAPPPFNVAPPMIVIENIILVLKMVLDSKAMTTNRAHNFGHQERDGIEGVAETT